MHWIVISGIILVFIYIYAKKISTKLFFSVFFLIPVVDYIEEKHHVKVIESSYGCIVKKKRGRNASDSVFIRIDKKLAKFSLAKYRRPFDRILIGKCVDFKYYRQFFGGKMLYDIEVSDSLKSQVLEIISNKMPDNINHEIKRNNGKIDRVLISLPPSVNNKDKIKIEITREKHSIDKKYYRGASRQSKRYNSNIRMMESFRKGENGTIYDLRYMPLKEIHSRRRIMKITFECDGTTWMATGACRFQINHNEVLSVAAVISERDMRDWESVVDIVINCVDEVINSAEYIVSAKN
ncbi:hypothetical protein [Motiliproteus sp.]|uniref:hypothetical protein n=1 Tax=Motiliproteus sp. TaxID=1898955 RepID=UPI003BA932E9